ncbi:GNAT family N-acetyltransferase [Cohnella suwonensis]|uniref:GNAT family N-acetyltransferase n=1 Tax=Cohnella suwonensis TaxID=696072 RepID=A0ABW0LSA8_9BACL
MEIVKIETVERLGLAFGIRVKVFVEEQGVPKELEMDEYDVSPEACRHFLALDGGEPVATGRYKTFEPGTAKMQRIAVLLSRRGQGVGKALLLAMEEDAIKQGFAFSLLDAQCAAEGFYEKLGYETISDEPFLDADIPHVRMRKSL